MSKLKMFLGLFPLLGLACGGGAVSAPEPIVEPAPRPEPVSKPKYERVGGLEEFIFNGKSSLDSTGCDGTRAQTFIYGPDGCAASLRVGQLEGFVVAEDVDLNQLPNWYTGRRGGYELVLVDEDKGHCMGYLFYPEGTCRLVEGELAASEHLPGVQAESYANKYVAIVGTHPDNSTMAAHQQLGLGEEYGVSAEILVTESFSNLKDGLLAVIIAGGSKSEANAACEAFDFGDCYVKHTGKWLGGGGEIPGIDVVVE